MGYAEAQREVVQKLLAKLREKERTVITLHYFGEIRVLYLIIVNRKPSNLHY
jgi:DNA-directed RNA polymerase specialized sigma subunit